MTSVLTKMLAQLSEEDKLIFEQLSIRLKESKGDISLLSSEDIKLIHAMESKYGDSINQSVNKINKSQRPHGTSETATVNILDTPFAQRVRQIIARDLGAKFPIEEDAVSFVFENKWLPIDCQDKSLAMDLYQEFKQDIDEANQWRHDLGDEAKDINMALALTWFMVIFQFNKRLAD